MRRSLPLLLLLPLALLAACSSAVPTETPGVERVGRTVLRYAGPEVEAVLGYRWAADNPGEDWLIVDLAITGTDDPIEIRREKIFIRTPSGETIPLATQPEFTQAYTSLRAKLNRVAIVADPLDYFGTRMECGLRFFAAPGEGLTFDSTTVDNRRVCSGRLFFDLPSGVQEGGYVFGIDLTETRLRIPFRVGESR